ncbi:hypothetical protein ASPWEDRAFT_38802 [Aspergillus wentii DTO 134E9]|uniref:Lincomycin-condensing protein lmbA n=1 Tax=Aspergillus wentii DTO 134E9 TaxID=1073089 RepID=A0A1L9RQP8_ASPWE|nr:uncharacterized protein ASPWEDRAFT_38802 [Aspergillus wentii DTO 134E9]OJJ37148.1 hypothetical protein ASPWEDRAFT_38802 [Aspergillus wentii DTO 134E9]
MGIAISCITGSNPPTTRARTTEDTASDILNLILTAESPESLRKQLHETVSTSGWTDAIAQALLNGLSKAIVAGAQMAEASRNALEKARDAAVGFATDHPVYATILAIGVLAILTPWVVEALGFAELGPVEGSFAAGWQRMYAGYVPKGSLFSFFQRLGMKWH